MVEDKYDGCGISNLISTGPKDPFYNACQWHDEAYSKGSFHEQNFSRKQMDLVFLAQMKLIAGKNLLLKTKAFLYYGIARLFGGTYWE